MLKKLLLVSALIGTTIASNTFAEGAPYVGASLGIVTNTSSSSNYRGGTASFLAGYGATVHPSIYLAGEGFVTLGSLTFENNPQATNVHTTYAYGLSFIPGFLFSDHTMGFARLGLVETRFSTMQSTVLGGQLGLGLQTSVSQNWSLRGEYDFVDYRKTNGISPRSDQFNLGLIYRIG